jgi:tetratricopeptide (TPR) repeat protein
MPRAALEAAAARARGIGAYASAAGYLADAIELAADDEERTRLREARLRQLYDANDGAGVEPEAWALIELGRELGDRGLQARAGFALAGALIGAGRPGEAMAAVVSIRDALGDFATEDPDGLRLTAELARCHLMSGEAGQAAALIEETLPIVERLGLRDVVAELLPSKGWALAAQGRPLEAMALHRGALAFAQRDGRFRAEMRARMNFSAVAGWEDTREAMLVARDGVERARERGYEGWAVSAAGNACSLAFLLGEWDWVLGTVAEMGLDERDGPWEQAPGLVAAAIHAYRGDLERAERTFGRIEAITAPLDDHQLRLDRLQSAGEIASPPATSAPPSGGSPRYAASSARPASPRRRAAGSSRSSAATSPDSVTPRRPRVRGGSTSSSSTRSPGRQMPSRATSGGSRRSMPLGAGSSTRASPGASPARPMMLASTNPAAGRRSNGPSSSLASRRRDDAPRSGHRRARRRPRRREEFARELSASRASGSRRARRCRRARPDVAPARTPEGCIATRHAASSRPAGRSRSRPPGSPPYRQGDTRPSHGPNRIVPRKEVPARGRAHLAHGER